MRVRPRAQIARVWDSCVITDYLAGKANALPHAKPIVDAARRGDVQLWISLFCEVEVAYLEGMADAQSEQIITDFFAEHYVFPLSIDPFVSEIARKLVRRFHIPGKDAIHVASALRWGAPIFETFDKRLIVKLEAPNPDNLLGSLVIREPLYDGTRTLFDLQPLDESGAGDLPGESAPG